MAEEATVNPDGSTTFEENTTAGEETFEGAEDILKEEAGVDPAIYFLLGLVLLGVLYYFLRPKAEVDDTDDFFSNLDGDKVSSFVINTTSIAYFSLTIFVACSSTSHSRRRRKSTTRSRRNAKPQDGNQEGQLKRIRLHPDPSVSCSRPS